MQKFQKLLCNKTVVMAKNDLLWFHFVDTLMRNKILGNVPKFQDKKMSSSSKERKCDRASIGLKYLILAENRYRGSETVFTCTGCSASHRKNYQKPTQCF